jgi:hypothetical protein
LNEADIVHHESTNTTSDTTHWLTDDDVTAFTGVAPSSPDYPKIKARALKLGTSDEAKAGVREQLELIRNVGARKPLSDHPMFADRENFPIALAGAGIAGPYVEIGVRNGDFAKDLISRAALLSTYHAVDPWAHQDSETYKDSANKDNMEQERLCRSAVVNIRAGFQARGVEAHAASRAAGSTKSTAPPVFYHVWRLFSDKAAREFANGSLAFVYIDGNHAFEPVLRDLEFFWPKLSPGGVIAGHDFDSNWPGGGPPKALEVFLKSRPELKLHFTEFAPRAEIKGQPVVFNATLGYYVPAPFKKNPGGVRFCCRSFWLQKPLS